jgi:hypothetical protein
MDVFGTEKRQRRHTRRGRVALNNISAEAGENAIAWEQLQEETKKQSENESGDQWINVHKSLSHLSTHNASKEWLESVEVEQRSVKPPFNLHESDDRPSPPVTAKDVAISSSTTDLPVTGNQTVLNSDRNLDCHGTTSIFVPPKIVTFPSYKGHAAASHVPPEMQEAGGGSPETG